MTPKLALLLSWIFFVGFVAGSVAFAVTTGPWSPNSLAGCRVVDAVPTYSAGALVALTCNTSGQLRLSTTP